MRILVTPTFERAAKKLHQKQKADLDEAVRAVAGSAEIGEVKVGDLAGIRVYKFRMTNQLCLLSYRVMDEHSIKLLTVGSHENFYRDLKRLESR
ncbi:MAG: type II toxin-antitoxin system RelE/ParE family toxin [Sterolibacterium sp.]